MANLLDISVSIRSVPTKKYGDISVPGLTLDGIAHLVRSHPELVDLFNQEEDLPIDKIIDLGTGIFADFLAAGLGYAGDEKAISMCKGMNPEDSLDIAVAILEESFPGGPKSFFDKVAQAAAKAQGSIQDQKAAPLKVASKA